MQSIAKEVREWESERETEKESKRDENKDQTFKDQTVYKQGHPVFSSDLIFFYFFFGLVCVFF